MQRRKEMNREILHKKLEILAAQMGKTVGFKEGQWFLDYASPYGGYIVVEFMNKGGEHHPLLNKRLKANQMADTLDMALAVCRVKGAI